MPAAAIAAPIAAVGMSAATSGFGIMTAITAVGAVASTIGTLTKTPALQYAGMGLSAVGALGSAAQSAGMFGGTGAEAAAGGQAQAMGAVAPMANVSPAPLAADPGVTAAAAASPAVAAPAPTVDPVLAATPPPTAQSQVAQLAAQPVDIVDYVGGPTIEPVNAPVIEQGGGEGTPLGNVPNPGAPPAGLVDTPAPAAPPQAKPAMPSTDSLINAPNTGGINKVGSTEGGSIWDRITGFAEKNQLLIMGALQAGGSFLSGATDTLKPAQVELLEARADLDKTQREDLERRMANARAGIPKASRRPRGLINSVAG